MMIAANNGHEKVVVALDGLGADVNAKSNVSNLGRESDNCVCFIENCSWGRTLSGFYLCVYWICSVTCMRYFFSCVSLCV